MKVIKTVSMDIEQAEWIKTRNINLSTFIRDKIKEEIKSIEEFENSS